MIRRRLSSGALRAVASPAALPATPLARPLTDAAAQRGLASAVLLSSSRNWQTETVATLKAELKRRSLSMTGNKATLVSRLSSAEQSAFLPPVPPVPTALKKAARARAVSTTAARGAPEPAEPVASTGPQVSSQRTEAPKVEPIKAEDVTVAPGLPASRDASKGVSGDRLDVKLPAPAPDAEADQIIPSMPDNFATSADASSAAPDSAAPKVMTVASASTHPAGGPVHGVHAATDAHETEAAEHDAERGPDTGAFALAPALASLLAAPTAAWQTMAAAMPSLGEAASAGGSSGGDGKAEFKKEDRPLDPHERTGLWILGGIVGGALLLGGSPRGGAEHHAHGAGHAGHAAGGDKGKNKGDAVWEKASGAGVVGHGARKD